MAAGEWLRRVSWESWYLSPVEEKEGNSGGEGGEKFQE